MGMRLLVGLAGMMMLLAVVPARADAGNFSDRFTLREWGVQAGGGDSLRSGVQLYTLQPYFGLAIWEPIDTFFDGIGAEALWVIEPWVAISDDTKGDSQSTSFEIGVSPIFFRLTFGDWKLRPYIEGGLGIVYTELRSEIRIGDTLGTRIQFASQGGVGLQYSLNPDMALALSARFRHISNAGMDSQNPGIDTIYGLLGFTFR